MTLSQHTTNYMVLKAILSNKYLTRIIYELAVFNIGNKEKESLLL